jgi:hypothetical protein
MYVRGLPGSFYAQLAAHDTSGCWYIIHPLHTYGCGNDTFTRTEAMRGGYLHVDGLVHVLIYPTYAPETKLLARHSREGLIEAAAVVDQSHLPCVRACVRVCSMSVSTWCICNICACTVFLIHALGMYV